MRESNDNKRGIKQAAADWLVRVQAPEVTEADLLEWDAWLKADVRHRRAFDALDATSAFIAREQNALADIPLPDADSVCADDYAGEHAIAELADSPPGRVIRARSASATRWAIAATVLFAVTATAWLGFDANWLAVREGHLQLVETRESEHRRIELDDGSSIELGAASSLSVNYSAKRRAVVLEAGEALFEVARDPNRPFVVLAGSGTITAVGTAFNVRRDADRVVVTVTEGEVEVVQQGGSPSSMTGEGSAAAPDPAPLRQTLLVGERVEYNAAGLARLDDVSPAAATEWRNGRLRYRAEPLKHVIPDVERYTPHILIIGDTAVGELKFTGTVFQDKADEWLRGLEQVFPVEVIELDDEQLLLRLREPAR